MKNIGIFICNYNKADFVVRCVQSIKNQTCQDTDIYVVDNASDDDSVKKLRENFGDSITILQNAENLGGSGGFGRGIRTAVEIGYKYFMLVDNDAFLDYKAVEYLYEYLEHHEDVGICGSETLYLQEPSKIQDLGGRIDYNHYQWGGVIGGLIELEGSAILECDYVASCSVMARTEAVRKFGGFPEENFIYWDDIEWCTRCWQAGYKVVVNGNAKALHDMSGANTQNMFLCYYANRNRYHFFTKYLPEEKLDDFYQVITEEFFRKNYGAMNKKKYGTVFTAWNALDDFMHGIRGKAKEGKIVPYTEGEDRLAGRIQEAGSILIYMQTHMSRDYHGLNSILRYVMKHNQDAEIMVTFSVDDDSQRAYDLVLELCGHVTKIQRNVLPRVYVDAWKNAVLDEKDFWYFRNYEKALSAFQEMYRPFFETRKRELRVSKKVGIGDADGRTGK